MPAIITNNMRIKNADAFAASAISIPSYVYIGKQSEWNNEILPDALIGADKEQFDVYNNMLALKKLEAGSIQSVCRRIDWKSGTVYDAYDHRVNMLASKTILGNTFYDFYVLTEEFNVYKCLSNNGGAKSTEQPTSQQVSAFQTSDGYIWKYMYTLRSGDVNNFLTTNWMPIYTLKYNDGSAQWQVQNAAIDGAIHRIELTNKGLNYSKTNPPTVVITGDGTGAEATLEVNEDNGSIARIIMVNVGRGYSYATVTLSNVGDGVGASAVAILSPVGGHGSAARAELGGTAKMFKITLTGDEGGDFPTTSFRQIGIISTPMSLNLGSKVSTNNVDGFYAGDSVQGGTTGATATVMFVNESIIWLQNVVGNFVIGEALRNLTRNGSSNITTAINNTNIPLIASTASKSEIVNRSGRLLYMSNREKITRATEQSEDVRIVIPF